jgi:predicted nucleic acid-binding Zn ribbon protein
VSGTEKARRPYIFPHRHCLYCGRMIEVQGRSYCLKCKPEYQKEQSKIGRSNKMRKLLIAYAIGVIVIFAVLLIYIR